MRVPPRKLQTTMTIIPISLLAIARWILYLISCGRKIPLDPRTLRPSNGPDACADYQFVAKRLADAHASVDDAGIRLDGLGFRFEYDATAPFAFVDLDQIGRASCRERV